LIDDDDDDDNDDDDDVAVDDTRWCIDRTLFAVITKLLRKYF